MTDNTILLGIITLLNTVYVLLLVQQNKDVKGLTKTLGDFIIEFTKLKQQHDDCQNCQRCSGHSH